MQRQVSKFGVAGLGKVGRSMLSQMSHDEKGFPIYWVADSGCVLSRGSEPFSPKEIRAIMDLKAKGRTLFSRTIPGARVDEFKDSREESRILSSIMTTKEEWLVLNAASMAVGDDYGVTKGMMGVAGVCTASKTSWADFGLCSDLYRRAERSGTFLGLNCTAGVWVDQMESLPLVVKYFTKGRITVTKRDNSSLNLFLARVDSSIKPDEAMKEVEAAGHLEPGAKDFSKEVHDQILKARIAGNICGVLSGIKPHCTDDTSVGRDRPHSISPADVALWHREGYRKGVFRALVTRLVLDLNREELSCTVSFGALPKRSPLARNLSGKSAIHIESTGRPTRSEENGRGRGTGYFHAAYGGGERTAAKLLWEARRVSRLRSFKGRVPFAPLPVLFAEDLGRGPEVRLRDLITASLVQR